MPKIAIISTVRAPLHELIMFINYHLNIGVDEIILFFDDPSHIDISPLDKYKNVTTIQCTSDYWHSTKKPRPEFLDDRQITNMTIGRKLSIKKNCDWVIHIDSDELIMPSSNLKDILTNCNADALQFSIVEAVSEDTYYDNIFITTLFKKKPNKLQIILAKLLSCKNALYNGEYFRGHTGSKMAFKNNSKIIKIGVHGPQEKDKTAVLKNTQKITLLHYDCVGFKYWKEKYSRMKSGGQAQGKNWRKNRISQVHSFAAADKKGDSSLLNLYEKLQIIPEREKSILFFLKMLTRIKLDKTLFSDQKKHL